MRCDGSKNGQPRWSRFIASVALVASVTFKFRRTFRDESVVSAAKIRRLHANCLRFGFRFYRRLEILRPFAEQQLLRHRMRECRSLGEMAGILERFVRECVGCNEAIEKALRD